MRYLAIEKIEENSILAKAVYDETRKILLNANVVLTGKYLDKLKELGYAGLYIYDEISSDIDIKDLISDETKRKAMIALKTLKIDDCIIAAHSLVDELIKQPSLSVDMISLSSFDNYTYVHCINVAVLSIIVGIGSGFTHKQIINLSEAALLHDIGKMKIDLDLLNKKEKLSHEEFDKLREHPIEGYEFVKENHEIKSIVKNTILLHHENEDGSGYPKGLQGKDIHDFVKIVHVCDVYDALVSIRTYKDEMNPADAIEYLMSNCGIMFDIKYVKKLIEYIAPYPTGITVELSNGEHALVTKQNVEYKTRPLITMIKTKEKIDLMQVLNLTIVKILK